ncbi:MAG: hypothetical protein PHX49_09420 [Bacteroidales bacterium]|nr:hypothetical protein [Bacteroidales bacterium]
MQVAFDWSIEQYIYFGGYPGSASLINDEERWKSYMILSYTKITGQLQDAGNTTTLANYLKLFSDCALLGGLEKYAGSVIL